MPGLIEELQRGALDPAMPVDSLLRRVQLAAVKLNLTDVEGWVHSELNGYDSDLPSYRKVPGNLKGWNPYHGWVPVLVQDDDLASLLSTAFINQSIGTLVDLGRHREGADEGIHYPLSPAHVNHLNAMMSQQSARYIIQLSRGTVIGILDRVRNMTLDWAIRMEQQGIIGEGISFSEAEKAQAKEAVTTINIGSIENMAGNLGSGNHSGAITADQSVNDAEVFASLADALQNSINDADIRQSLLASVQRMEQTRHSRADFAAAYGEFITMAAAHITIVAPFLPALVSFLG